MNKQQKTSQAIQALNRAYGLALDALTQGTKIDFTLFDNFKALHEEADAIVQTESCIQCLTDLEIGLDSYSRLIVQQLNVSKGKKEEIKPLSRERSAIYFCIKCGENILKFLETSIDTIQEVEDKEED